MVTHLVLELDYPFLHISALEDVYINSALYKCFLLTYLLAVVNTMLVSCASVMCINHKLETGSCLPIAYHNYSMFFSITLATYHDMTYNVHQ